jgi:hypothetical protein
MSPPAVRGIAAPALPRPVDAFALTRALLVAHIEETRAAPPWVDVHSSVDHPACVSFLAAQVACRRSSSLCMR